MTEHRLMITGVHYAANPEQVAGQPDTEEMHVRTLEMLRWVRDEAPFNWQSQNSASHQNSGRRYVEQRTNGRKFLLFVREHKVDAYGFTSPYYCLGLVDYVKSHGDRPMTITWAMQNRIPGFILDKAQKMAVG